MLGGGYSGYILKPGRQRFGSEFYDLGVQVWWLSYQYLSVYTYNIYIYISRIYNHILIYILYIFICICIYICIHHIHRLKKVNRRLIDYLARTRAEIGVHHSCWMCPGVPRRTFFVNAQIDLQTAAASSMSACLRTARNETAHPTLLRPLPNWFCTCGTCQREETGMAWKVLPFSELEF